MTEVVPPGSIERRRAKVLVVDDEPAIGDVVSRYLKRAGYETTVAANGHDALGRAEAARPDVVVPNLMLPDTDGLEVMRRLRRDDLRRGAIILLTARGEESDRIVGLRLGADDYVVKPFSPAELVARVDAVLRRVDTAPAHQEPLLFDGLEIDPSARRVTVVIYSSLLGIWAARALGASVLVDLDRVRAGLARVGHGERDIEIRTGGRDELAELARDVE